MNKNTICISILKTSVRGSSKETYNLLVEENDLTIIFYPLLLSDEVFNEEYKSISDVLEKISGLDETKGYFCSSYGSEPDEFLVGLLKGTLKVEDLPDYIELEGFEGLY